WQPTSQLLALDVCL
ncbi:DUF645 family protein, partial [Vibrio cholerae]|nr:DUF645 family protein [Vibrio cholerae]